ncbi:MAG: TIGR00730 family Rossman fold protein [Casimicrobiaceae bacterium]
MTRVCVFCGSSPGNRPVYAEAARELGTLIGKRGIGLVYGGGRNGLMGIVADAALAAGAEVTGIITEQLHDLERGHSELTAMHIVDTMHERKAAMATMADGFIALAGGYGTLEELCEMITWTQLGIHDKRCVAVNTEGYFDPLIAQFDRAVDDGFLRPAARGIFISVDTASAAIGLFATR